MVTAVKLKIYGRVQRVLFRISARRIAGKCGVNGWVRNADDGTVEVFAQGNGETLRQFIAWCHRGPFFAKVTKVEETPETPSANITAFIITS